jgi:hypothetical protein
VPATPLLPILHRLRPGPALASLLALIAIAVALVAPARTLAYTHHRSACPASSAKQRAHHVRACAKPSHRAKAHTRRAGRLVLVRRAPKPTDRRSASTAYAPRGSARSAVTPPSPAPSDQLAASCDDGSEPALAAEETFACDDGSEPSCEDGSELVLSGDGSKLLCSGSAPEPEAGEAEDGGEPAGDPAAPPRQPSPTPSSHRSSGS